MFGLKPPHGVWRTLHERASRISPGIDALTLPWNLDARSKEVGSIVL